jgi:hypothetical protein
MKNRDILEEYDQVKRSLYLAKKTPVTTSNSHQDMCNDRTIDLLILELNEVCVLLVLAA